MQAVYYSAPPSLRLSPPFKTSSSPSWLPIPNLYKTSRSHLLKVNCTSKDPPTADYSSKNSVFPAEACETIGGEACDAEIYPETKLKSGDGNTKPKTSSEPVDREYMEYNEPKTVFPGEACDDLGGEFCGPDYQKGVYKDKA